MKGYGGFITDCPVNTEYFVKYKEENILRLNAARYGIIEAFRDGGFHVLWLPVYMCKSVYEAIEKEGIPYKKYHINEHLLPELESTDEYDCILITNYFGIKGNPFYADMCARYKNIIFDNTQCFFSDPVFKENVYNVYSPRKFFPICDGAYVITKSFRYNHILPDDFSGRRAAFLFRAVEEGTDAVYELYNACEDELSESGVRGMSQLTRCILSNIPYEKIRSFREANLSHVMKRLSGYNEFDVGEICTHNPMVYPLIIKDKGIREYLIDHHIYVSQWWKWVLDCHPNGVEESLSKFLLPIPIDQRYSVEDVEKVCCIIENYCKNIR